MESLKSACRCRWLCWIQCCITGAEMNHDEDIINDFMDSFNKNSNHGGSHTPTSENNSNPDANTEEKQNLLT